MTATGECRGRGGVGAEPAVASDVGVRRAARPGRRPPFRSATLATGRGAPLERRQCTPAWTGTACTWPSPPAAGRARHIAEPAGAAAVSRPAYGGPARLPLTVPHRRPPPSACAARRCGRPGRPGGRARAVTGAGPRVPCPRRPMRTPAPGSSPCAQTVRQQRPVHASSRAGRADQARHVDLSPAADQGLASCRRAGDGAGEHARPPL